jgi:opacity protein-like surface antigen
MDPDTLELMRHAIIAIVLILGLPAPGTAQDRSSPFVGGSVSAANMSTRTEIAYAGLFGYRFSRVVSFVIEATVVPEVRSSFPGDSPFIQTASSATRTAGGSSSVVIFPGPFFSNPGGRIVLFTNTARIDIPTTSSRVTPFFAAGGGVANVRRTADFSYPLPLLPTFPPGLPVDIRPITQRVTSSSTDLALTLGGGVGVRVASSLWVDADLRVFRLFGSEDRNLGRFGVGVRYAF